jgi:hypothetical protein
MTASAVFWNVHAEQFHGTFIGGVGLDAVGLGLFLAGGSGVAFLIPAAAVFGAIVDDVTLFLTGSRFLADDDEPPRVWPGLLN